MRALSENDIIHVWEMAQGQHPLDRALTMLQVALPDVSRHTLAQLTIGQRDSCLFALRSLTFGASLVSRTNCPSCPEQIEFALDQQALQIHVSIEPVALVYRLLIDDGEIQFRLPNSIDLAALIHARSAVDTDLRTARALLLRRCVIQVMQHGTVVPVESLSEAQILQLGYQMDQQDHLAEILIDLDCAACGYHWQVVFDIVSFFWAEISAQARRLLYDVHTLARAYGWREADILALSSARRQFYLEMVSP